MEKKMETTIIKIICIPGLGSSVLDKGSYGS